MGMLSVKQAAAEVGVSPRTIREWRSREWLPDRNRFTVEELHAALGKVRASRKASAAARLTRAETRAPEPGTGTGYEAHAPRAPIVEVPSKPELARAWNGDAPPEDKGGAAPTNPQPITPSPPTAAVPAERPAAAPAPRHPLDLELATRPAKAKPSRACADDEEELFNDW